MESGSGEEGKGDGSFNSWGRPYVAEREAEQ